MNGQFYLNLLFLLVPAGLIALWWTGSRARELATGHARTLCQRESVQLLDHTVALKRIRLSRSASGAHCLKRTYIFEFTAEGQHRDAGSVELNGHALARVSLPYTRDEDGNRVFLH